MSPSTVLYDPCIVMVLYTISTAGLTSQTRSSTLRNNNALLCKKSNNFYYFAPLLKFHEVFFSLQMLRYVAKWEVLMKFPQ